MKKFVVYSRLSKQKKGEAQYGMESQENDIRYFLDSVPDAEVIGQFSEYYSGKGDWKQRKELVKAVEMCKATGATLLVAKVDRLGRNNASVATLLEMIDVKIAIMPDADKMVIQLLSVLAEQEVRGIADRIKKGLAVAKSKGVLLGSANPKTAAARRKGKMEYNSVKADAFAETFREQLEILRDLNTPYKTIAEKFNSKKIATARGGKWDAKTVSRLCARLNIK